jgi:putative copper resistance protein D
MGSLMLILIVGSRLGSRESLLVAQLRAFSPVALTAVPVLILMGGALSFYHLSAIQDLWSTPYGRILFGKLMLAGTVLILGLLNWRLGLPTLESATGRRTVCRRAAWEVATAGIVLAFTAFLTGTPTP